MSIPANPDPGQTTTLNRPRALRLHQLLNVAAIPYPPDGSILIFNAATGDWEPNQPPDPDKSLDSLTDVTLTSPANNDRLVYDATLSQWKNAPPVAAGLTAQQAVCTAILTLTTTATDVPGCSLTLAQLGTYLVIAVCDFLVSGTGDVSFTFEGILVSEGVAQPSLVLYTPGADHTRATVTQTYLITPTAANAVVKLQALKLGGSGTSEIRTAGTTLTAVKLA